MSQPVGPRAQLLARRLSMAETLSLLTSAIVLSVLAAAIVITWVTLTRSTLAVERDRLARGVRQLAAVTATSVRTSNARYLAVARTPAIHRALSESAATLRAADTAAVHAALAKLVAPADSGLPIELWRADGRRLAFVGDDIGDAPALEVGGEGRAASASIRPGLDHLSSGDSLQLGALYGAAGRTYLWLALPIRDNGRVLGYILQQRRIARNPQTEQTVRELSGDSVTGYYRNLNGTNWTTFGGLPAAPLAGARTDSSTRMRSGARVVFAESRIEGTPLVLSMDVPEHAVLAGVRATVRRLALFGVILTLIGAVLAWLAGRKVARPLGVLSDAADAVARGDYATRVPTRGSDEVARLAARFNEMAGQIGESRSDLERREEELRALADAIPQLAWMADERGTIFWLNQRWHEFAGVADRQSFDQQWIRAIQPAAVAEVTRRWRSSVDAGEPFEMEIQLRRADGEYRWFLTRAVPVRDRDGHLARWFGTSTDIQSLREAREAAQSANRAKSDFLAAMSHELRTPLNAIGGYTELIEMEIRGPISDEQRRDLARIRSSQQHLLGLIGGMLDLSRIESGRVHYDIEPVAVAPVFVGLEALIAPLAAAKRQVLDLQPCDEMLVVLADREKLRQVLLNLLSNAVRHTPIGSTITVTAEALSDTQVRIMVSDTGPGIPVAMHDAVFEPFVQLDRSLTRSKEGVGLGLAISRDLARGMGGELSVLPVRSGACFAVTLPRGEFDAATNIAITTETPAISARRPAAT